MHFAFYCINKIKETEKTAFTTTTFTTINSKPALFHTTKMHVQWLLNYLTRVQRHFYLVTPNKDETFQHVCGLSAIK